MNKFDLYCRGHFEERPYKFGEKTGPHSYVGMPPPGLGIVPPSRTMLSGFLARDYLPRCVEVFEQASARVALGVGRRTRLRSLEGDVHKWLRSTPHYTPVALERLIMENELRGPLGRPLIPEHVEMPREWREPDGPVGSPTEEVAYRLEVDSSLVYRWLSWEDAVPPEYALRICLMSEAIGHVPLASPNLERPGARTCWWRDTGRKVSPDTHLDLFDLPPVERPEESESYVVGCCLDHSRPKQPKSECPYKCYERSKPRVGPSVDYAEVGELIGGLGALARYCKVRFGEAQDWMLGRAAPSAEKRWAVVEANAVGRQIVACLGYLKGRRASAFGGTPQARSSLRVDLENFRDGTPQPSVDVIEALDELLLAFHRNA